MKLTLDWNELEEAIVEWSATRPDRAGEPEACCAVCGSAKDKGHSPNCTFAKPRG